MGGFFFSLLHKASAAFHRRIAGSAGETGLLDGVAADSPFAMASKEFEKQVKRVDEAMHLMQTISLEVGDASDLRSALKITAGKICNFTGWSFGEVWVPNFDGSALEYYSAWHGRKEVLGAFAETSMGMIFPPGVGLPGRVWRTKEPEWIKDVSAGNGAFLRAGDALAAGFKAGFGVPIVAGGEVAAVMVFFMTEAGDDDARLIELVSTAAIHLGTVIRRRISEYAREEIKRRYEELINNIAAGIYRSVPGEGRFIEANRAFVDMMGAQSKEELLKQDPAVFYQDKGKMKEINEKLSSGGFIKNLEVELVTLQGRRIWVSTSVVMKRDREGKTYCDGIVEDITGRKRLEEQLIHSQRMEAVGQLAAGIAHDFNNILTAIIGYANLLAMKTQGEPSKGFVDHIRALSERAAALVAGLMAFGRKQPVRLQALDLNSAVRSAQNIFARVIGEHIALKAFFSKKELAVMADPVQIEQVLMNLATNARDAMPGGGTLSIATAMAGPDDEFLSLRGVFQPRGYALITFTDTGRGMDEETRKRIFEPFFTTKETGKGTGLGLSMVYGIIKQHGGLIDVWSEPGRGSAFMIYLPIAGHAATGAESPEAAPPEGGTETVLLAEDEDEVRTITKAMLEEFGYRVIAAFDGEDAVKKFMDNKESVQLIILDVIMPRKGGRQACEEIREIRPDIKVIFITGHAVDNGAVGDARDFLLKPVPPAALLRKVREVIDR